ncbi:unnamed protein product, partial [Mesorhabditis belari]|uniref:DUF4440 domain-containing protein n=1 Tax=Mesorhabditis belari TaxID=2138241 RepID=A0AAF3FNP8_9BILA
MSSLETTLRPFIDSFEKADNASVYYQTNGLLIDEQKKTVTVGRDEINAVFAGWATLGKFTIKAANESFSGSEDTIRYAARHDIEFESAGKKLTFNVVQYWRRDGDHYLIEVERFNEI